MTPLMTDNLDNVNKKFDLYVIPSKGEISQSASYHTFYHVKLGAYKPVYQRELSFDYKAYNVGIVLKGAICNSKS